MDFAAEHVSLFVNSVPSVLAHFCPAAIGMEGASRIELELTVGSFFLQLFFEILADVGSAVAVSRFSPLDKNWLLRQRSVFWLYLGTSIWSVASHAVRPNYACLLCKDFDATQCGMLVINGTQLLLPSNATCPF